MCMEVFHKPVSLLPCLHTFCSGCFSKNWKVLTRSQKRGFKCPVCRQITAQIKRNHTINNIIRASKIGSRPEEALLQLDADDIVTKDAMNLSDLMGQGSVFRSPMNSSSESGRSHFSGFMGQFFQAHQARHLHRVASAGSHEAHEFFDLEVDGLGEELSSLDSDRRYQTLNLRAQQPPLLGGDASTPPRNREAANQIRASLRAEGGGSPLSLQAIR